MRMKLTMRRPLREQRCRSKNYSRIPALSYLVTACCSQSRALIHIAECSWAPLRRHDEKSLQKLSVWLGH